MSDLYRSLNHLSEHQVVSETHAKNNDKSTMGAFKILLAEDNEVNMYLAKTIVKRIVPEAAIIEAYDGGEAVDLCQKHLPDIILMDIQMPEVNGYEASAKIRELLPEQRIPIIALTAGVVKGEKERCLAAGMDDFVAKPIVEHQVRKLFDKWLKAHEQGDLEEQGDEVHLNEEKIMEYVAGDEDFREVFLNLTAKELIKSFKTIQAHVDSQNLKALQSAGHKLKGTALTAGLSKVASIALSFESQEHFEPTEITRLITQLEQEINTVFAIIKTRWDIELSWDKEYK
jgi:CheY-like chemotaxis protein/HPt (histidine-containing phosphotransfer) domain-containing protein